MFVTIISRLQEENQNSQKGGAMTRVQGGRGDDAFARRAGRWRDSQKGV